MNLANFLTLSEKLLHNIFYEPGGFSFFPSTFFWSENNINLDKLYKKQFSSDSKNNLYIHIPFCERICSYCNCFKSKLSNKNQIITYLEYLEKEASLLVEQNNGKKIKIENIFIGGGTPNILNIDELKILFGIIYNYFILNNGEFLIDCHPNFLDDEKIKLFKENKVSRVTLAIQTLDEFTLKQNNRDIYDLDKIKNLIKSLNKNNIKINIDLVIGLAGQTIESLNKDIEFILDNKIDNVSDHYLMNSNNFKYDFGENYYELVKYFKTQNHKLPRNSENKIESDFSNNNISMLSLGASSVTHIYENIIYSKPNLKDYYKSLDENILPIQKSFLLNKKYEMIKYIYLNILEEINILDFYNKFGEDIFQVFKKEFSFLKANNSIEIKGNIIKPTLSDFDMMLFLGIFFIDKFKDIKNIPNLKKYYFLEDGSLIDK